MKFAIVAALIAAAGLAAQTAQQQPLPKGQMPDLGRPTTIGGDLGGIYNIFFESSPFTVNGKTIRIKHTLRLMSPMNYRVATSVSVDGGKFANYGNPWWRKTP